MSGFEYNTVDFETVVDVDIISRQSEEYRSYLSELYDSRSTPQYEEWVEEHPEIANQFLELAEEALESPWDVCNDIMVTVFESEDSTCGDCWHQRNDDYRNGEEKIVCWENKPDESSHKPRKLTTDSELATQCDQFSPNDEFSREKGIHPKLTSQYFISDLAGDDGDEEQRKAALKYAFYQSWGMCEEKDTKQHNFHPQREEAMLRELQSEKAKEKNTRLGQGGMEFEGFVRDKISGVLDLPLRGRVFRIQTTEGRIKYKEMDLHTRIGNDPIIAELYTQRLAKKKKRQLADYAKLYYIATGFRPKSFLVTDEIVRWEFEDGEGQKVNLEKGGEGQIIASVFFERLRERKGIDADSINLEELRG